MLGCSLSAALFHFTCIAIYSFKVNTSAAMPLWLTTYCSTLFYQDWKLFVPPPHHNYKLIVVLPNKQTIDVFAQVRGAHQHNRLAGKGFELLSFVNSIHHFEKGCAVNGGNVTGDPNFALLQYSCTQFVNQLNASNYKRLPLILYVSPIGDFPARSYFAY